jgi:RHS repeat-associated protein
MERDAESGNDHTQFRQFMPNFGRWMSPDPLAGDVTNPQSLNRYAYVMNNPINLTDVLGLGSGETSGPPCNGPGQPSCMDYFGTGNIPPGFEASVGQPPYISLPGSLGAPDMILAEANYNSQVQGVFDLNYLRSIADSNGGIPIGQAQAFVSTHPDLWLGFGLLASDSAESINAGQVILSDIGLYGYYVVQNQLALAGMMAAPAADLRLYAVWGSAYATPFAATAGVGAYEFTWMLAANYPAATMWATQIARGAFLGGPATGLGWVIGKGASAGWSWWKNH